MLSGNRKIRRSGKTEIEPQEILLDRMAQKKIEDSGFSGGKMETPLSRKCFYGVLFLSFSLFLMLFLRSFQLQIIKGEEFFSKAERNRFAFSSIQSSRGIIYDRNLNQLVFNQPIFNLIINKKDLLIDEKEIILKKLAGVVNMDSQKLIEDFEKSNLEDFVVLNNLNYDDLIALEIKTRNLSGVEIRKETIRHYENDKIFSHLIGYIGKISPEEMSYLKESYSINDKIGKVGLEKSYEDALKIIPGKIKIERDASGRSISEELVADPQSGNSLILNIDSELQKKAYYALEKILADIGSKNASVVAMNPQTGEVLALVSFPGFDNNAFSVGDNERIGEIFNDPAKPLFNRAIAGLYPVGSSIKPFIGIAALQEGIVTAGKQFYSAGSITIPNPWDPSRPSVFLDWMAHGWVNLKKAIAVSSNVYFYIVGGGYENQKGLGPDLIKKHLNIFGWGEKTGVDLPDEKDGFIPDPEWKKERKGELWRIGDSYNLSIGQGDIAVTPIQVASAYSAIANEGKLMRPVIVKEIINDQRETIKTQKSEIIRENFASFQIIREVREGMREAVLYGSATVLQSLPVTSAAKTGTAQISKAGHYHNWVSVFAPYDNPEIVLVIVIEEVEGVRAAALPVAKEILDWHFRED